MSDIQNNPIFGLSLFNEAQVGETTYQLQEIVDCTIIEIEQKQKK